MKPKLLATDEITPFVDNLLANGKVYGPRQESDYVVYGQITAPRELDLAGGMPRKSAKEVIFPQEQTMFTFEVGDNHAQPCMPDNTQTVLLGARPCDLQGIAVQDEVFLSGTHRDPYYEAMRKRAVLFGLACPEMLQTCFCNSFGIDPHAPVLGDCLMAPVSGGYVLFPVTEKCHALIADLPDASEGDLEKAKKASVHFHENENAKVPVDSFVEHISEVFESSEWEEVVEGCLNCGACTYICPTCHCFDIADEVIGDKGRRIRAWDTCMACNFTLHTSGHNPRTKPEQRIRQRVLHKFQYMSKNIKMIGCTGCGRCVALCPVNWDIRDVIGRLEKKVTSET